jgi:tyrosinase
MTTMRSPQDPIFWLHHAQVDRLWHAWALAAEGRRMPSPGDAYWDGELTIHDGLTIARRTVFDPRAELAYTYDDESLPEALPQQALTRRGFMRASLRGKRKPAMLRAAMDGPHAHRDAPGQAGASRRSIGGVRGLALNDKPVSARIPVRGLDRQALQWISGGAEPARAAELVLDDLRVTPAGEAGGYLYRVYLNAAHDGAAAASERRRVGSFGPFEIAGARHHGDAARLAFQITEALQDMAPEELGELDITFMRVGGNAASAATVIVIGEVRVELSAEGVR